MNNFIVGTLFMCTIQRYILVLPILPECSNLFEMFHFDLVKFYEKLLRFLGSHFCLLGRNLAPGVTSGAFCFRMSLATCPKRIFLAVLGLLCSR